MAADFSLMPTISLTLNVRANDGSTDNQLIGPTGGDVYVELNRGFNCVIPSFGVAICTPHPAKGGFTVETTLEEDGQFPSSQDPTGPAPLYRLGRPTDLLNRCIVIVTSAATDSGTSGSISVIVRLLEQNADQTFRRIAWTDDSAQAIQLQSRFEVDILP